MRRAGLPRATRRSRPEDHRAATGSYASSALLDKKNAKTWLKLAREYLAIDTEKYGEKQTFARNGGSSAYLAFTHGKAPADQAAALAVLAGKPRRARAMAARAAHLQDESRARRRR